MKIGITEILKSGRREFSDSELLECLDRALEVYPLNVVYTKSAVIEPIPSPIPTNFEEIFRMGDTFTDYRFAEVLTRRIGKGIHQKYGIDALITTLSCKSKMRNIDGGVAFSRGNGKGAAVVYNAFYTSIMAHEIGHFWDLDHCYPDGTYDMSCVMHANHKKLVSSEVTKFSDRNAQAILRAYYKTATLKY
jgi:hypothetical protein